MARSRLPIPLHTYSCNSAQLLLLPEHTEIAGAQRRGGLARDLVRPNVRVSVRPASTTPTKGWGDKLIATTSVSLASQRPKLATWLSSLLWSHCTSPFRNAACVLRIAMSCRKARGDSGRCSAFYQ